MAPAQRGFTIVELVVVIVLIGILGAIAGSRFFDRGMFEVPSSAEQVRTLLRHAQKQAIARNAPVFVRFEPNRISLCHGDPTSGCPANLQVPIPGSFTSGDEATRTHCGDANWYCLGRPAHITVTISPVVNWLSFDGLGRPMLSNGGTALTLTISAAGAAGTRTVSVVEETGYVR